MTGTPPPIPVASRAADLKVRTLTGFALVAVALVALLLGGIAFWLLCVIAALFMMAEWSNLHGVPPKEKRLAQYALSVPLALTAPASLILEVRDWFTLGLLAGAAFFIVIVTRLPRLALGILYCGLPVLALSVLRRADDGLVLARGDDGLVLTLWALALVWACDIGAYFAGRSIGGPKLAPTISPSKTWAGLAGGVVAAAVFGAYMYWEHGLPALLALATPLLAVAAQGGDLYESVLKRRAGVKDSGDILPGHGGVMDRLDGLVPVAPIAAALVLLAGAAR